MDSTTDIFISYRRADGRDIARTIQLALRNAGKYNVFFDYSSLRDGVFNDKIYTAIDQCRVFVLVLSPDSLTRCAADGDWVAIEINRAKEAGCTIIPLAIDSNYDKWPADLPESLHFLKTIQQTKLLTDEYFDESISRLLQRIAAAPPKKITVVPENDTAAASAWEVCLSISKPAATLSTVTDQAPYGSWRKAPPWDSAIRCRCWE